MKKIMHLSHFYCLETATALNYFRYLRITYVLGFSKKAPQPAA